MELSDYLRLLKRSWALLLIGALLGTALGAAYLFTQPVLYSATSSTYVSVSSASDISSAASGSQFAKDAAADLATIATSPFVLDEVRTQLGLDSSAAELADQISVQVVDGTSVLKITATTTQPRLSAALADATATRIGVAAADLNPNVGNAASVARATTIGNATTPSAPVSPSVTFDLAVGLLGGFALALLLVLLRQAVDQRIRSAEQLARVAHAPVIGAVPELPPPHEGAARVLVPALVDQFRSVRSEILEGASQNRVVVVSGTRRGETTASFASGIAASIANARLTTLLIDAAGDTAPAAPVFSAPTDPGMTEALERSSALEQLVTRTSVSGLWYLPPGRPSAGREDLVASFEMTDLLEAAIGRFNVIVINTDPVEDSPIGRILGRQADGVVLISEIERSSVPEVRRAVESLERGGARLIGVVAVSREEKTRRRRVSNSSRSRSQVELKR